MDTGSLMQGFPPSEDDQVTLANWRKPPFNRWSFSHVREIVPSAEIMNYPEHIRELPSDPLDLASFQLEMNGGRYDLPSFLEQTDTDSMVVLHKGKIAYEFYRPGIRPELPHILMSVSKSVLGLITGILLRKNLLDLAAPVTDYIPEVRNSAYAGATLRNLLDMRVGVLFDEDYLANSGPII